MKLERKQKKFHQFPNTISMSKSNISNEKIFSQCAQLWKALQRADFCRESQVRFLVQATCLLLDACLKAFVNVLIIY